MSDPKYKWKQPAAPPPPMFFGSKERDLVKQVNDELVERVIGQTIAYYPISIEESNFNDTYGEAIDKVSLPPVRVYAFVEVENEQSNEKFGYEYQTKLTINFHRRRLVEDQNLYVRVGDFVQYGDQFYEIVRTYNDTRFLFGQVQHKFQISAECVRARRGLFRVMPSVDRPGDAVAAQGEGGAAPAPRAAPYPPLDASYIVVTGTPKLPNDRALAAGSNISITDGGPNGAITVATTSELTASNMRVTGDLTLVGTLLGGSPVKISGSVEIIDNTGATIATLGSSSLGSDVLSASFAVVTNVSASGYVSASNFYGDGGGITNLPVAAISSYTNPANNRVITSVDASTVTGEANLTFDGSLLTVTGDVTASANISASAFYGDGSQLDNITTTAAGASTQIQFNTSDVFDASANLTYDGSTLVVQAASHLSGGLVLKRTAITTNYSIALTDYYLGVDTTSNTVELTVPVASTATEGQTFVIKDEGANTATNAITISRSGTDTIDGAVSAEINSPYGSFSLYTDGANWFIY